MISFHPIPSHHRSSRWLNRVNLTNQFNLPRTEGSRVESNRVDHSKMKVDGEVFVGRVPIGSRLKS